MDRYVESLPVSHILPSSGKSKPAIIRNKVDLPDPDGPTSATNDPVFISRLT